jgi:hypothetical protein
MTSSLLIMDLGFSVIICDSESLFIMGYIYYCERFAPYVSLDSFYWSMLSLGVEVFTTK